MKPFFVSGIVNVENSLNVDRFPVEYNPIEYPFFGISSCVSGVGYNVTKALKTLGAEADLATIMGDDLLGHMVQKRMEQEGISLELAHISNDFPTSESIIIVDKSGKRKIYCDLKHLQDTNEFPGLNVDFSKYECAALTNINYNRGLLRQAKATGCKIATDVHVLFGINDDYNQEFMEYADILFLSNEAIRGHEGAFLKSLYERFHNPIIVCGCAENGALCYLGDRDEFYYESAKVPNGIASTVGAGDALFSCFLYFYFQGYSITDTLKFAVTFAGLKIGQDGGSNGFVSEEELRKYVNI